MPYNPVSSTERVLQASPKAQCTFESPRTPHPLFSPLVPQLTPTSCVPPCVPTTRQDRVKYLTGLLEKHESQNMTFNMVRHSRAYSTIRLTLDLAAKLLPLLLS